MTQDWINTLPRNRLLAEYSMWSANLLRVEEDLQRIAAHADVLHIDVADGHFAPAMLFFPDLVAAMRKATRIPIHIHLMVADSVLTEQAMQFADAGADLISVHVENETADEAIAAIAARGLAAGVVLKVETPVARAQPFLDRIGFLTLLGAAIGVKGQGLNQAAPQRLTDAKAMIAASGVEHRIVLAADGGIREHTVPLLRAGGAETVVLGSLAFGAPSLDDRMAWLKSLA
jgi:ribulose-phosphate 3-epimerase